MHAYIHMLYSQYSRRVDVYILSYYMHIQFETSIPLNAPINAPIRRADRLRAKATI